MEPKKSRLLIVEHVYFSRGHGVIVFPKIPIASYSGPHRRLVTVRTPDGRGRTASAQIIEPFVTPHPKERFYLCFLPSLVKADVPIGTEIWIGEDAV